MKQRANNIVLLMSAGSGTRFGADRPKQYCLMQGKPIIEYALDVCRISSSVDEIVIVTSAEYVETIRDKYGFPTTCGGENRTISLANGLKYINDNYECENIIIANAVCPLMTEEQLDKYFFLLNDYDYVLTSWKVTSTLARYDGRLVDRDDYFHVMEPEAYKFKMLYENYNADYPVPYNFHQLPESAKGYYCFDYPYTMKITYASDIKIAELLYDELIVKPRNTKTLHNINLWLSSYMCLDNTITEWLSSLPKIIEEISNKWGITALSMNPEARATAVYEVLSEKYGKAYLKLYAPNYRFQEELLYYQKSTGDYMATLLDYDEDYRALLIEKIVPGVKMKFDKDDERFRRFFDKVNNNMIPASSVESVDNLPNIIGEWESSKQKANNFNYHNHYINAVNSVALDLYNKYFSDAELFYLHRDLHRRNLLRCDNEIKAIDPLGIIGPREFEYPISILIEIKQNPEEYRKIINEMLEYFSVYTRKEQLYCALFITLVHKLNEYIVVKNDGFKSAEMLLNLINHYFLNDNFVTEKENLISIFEKNKEINCNEN